MLRLHGDGYYEVLCPCGKVDDGGQLNPITHPFRVFVVVVDGNWGVVNLLRAIIIYPVAKLFS